MNLDGVCLLGGGRQVVSSTIIAYSVPSPVKLLDGVVLPTTTVLLAHFFTVSKVMSDYVTALLIHKVCSAAGYLSTR